MKVATHDEAITLADQTEDSVVADDDPDDDFAYWDFFDLQGRKIVNNRQDLSNKIRTQGFPGPVTHMDGRSTRALYVVRRVKKWLRENERPRTGVPSVLKPTGKRRGRQPKRRPAEEVAA